MAWGRNFVYCFHRALLCIFGPGMRETWNWASSGGRWCTCFCPGWVKYPTSWNWNLDGKVRSPDTKPSEKTLKLMSLSQCIFSSTLCFTSTAYTTHKAFWWSSPTYFWYTSFLQQVLCSDATNTQLVLYLCTCHGSVYIDWVEGLCLDMIAQAFHESSQTLLIYSAETRNVLFLALDTFFASSHSTSCRHHYYLLLIFEEEPRLSSVLFGNHDLVQLQKAMKVCGSICTQDFCFCWSESALMIHAYREGLVNARYM